MIIVSKKFLEDDGVIICAKAKGITKFIKVDRAEDTWFAYEIDKDDFNKLKQKPELTAFNSGSVMSPILNSNHYTNDWEQSLYKATIVTNDGNDDEFALVYTVWDNHIHNYVRFVLVVNFVTLDCRWVPQV